ncbi:MAG: alpha-L-rhamnosidase N-terminal domain-containing protein, partial [Candidatus Hydrogenedentes bacterium]|nr:alpha-L-rhamnosidase N-terminal domain-containing protein [Candidatus Hydrogenedentota bacterium]
MMRTVLIGILFVLAFSLRHASAQDIGASLQRHMIWAESAPAGTQVYAAFRRVFRVDSAPKSAVLHIFADSRYILWLNGRYIERGPCRFDPQEPAYDSVDVTSEIREGDNVLAVLVHHYHDGRATDDPTALNGRMMRHQPGLAARLDLELPDGQPCSIVTDAEWRVTTDTSYRPSPVSWASVPDNIDARIDEGDWAALDYDDAAWQHSIAVDGSLWGGLVPRAIPMLREEPFVPQKVVRAPGVEAGQGMPLGDALPLTLEAEQEAVIDVGRAVLAYEVLDFDAQAGTAFEVRHGSGYVNGHLDEAYIPNRYVCRDGRQQYMAGDISGFRYLLIRVNAGALTLHDIHVVNRTYPFERLGSFACNDGFLDELWERSVRTISLCSEDGYTDCSARERVEWMGDAAVCEYPVTRAVFAGPGPDGGRVYSDPRLIRNMLRHIALSQQPDGRLKAHHPSNRWDIHGYIEDYACLWICTLRSYYENTEDLAEVGRLWPYLTRQLDWFLAHRTENGLVRAREFVFFDNPLSYKTCEGASLNAYLAGAFRDAAFLARRLGRDDEAARYEAHAREADEAINTHLWNEEAGAYHGGIMDGQLTPPTPHAAMAALYFGSVPEARIQRVRDYLVANLEPIGSPYSYCLLLDVLYRQNDPAYDSLALDSIRRRWASTIARTDLDTVFEGFGGGALCHNIGSSPAYFLSTRVLGVRREGCISEGGLIVDPRPGDLVEAHGAVVTELGVVPVSWQRRDGAFTLDVTIPAGAEATVVVPAAEDAALHPPAAAQLVRREPHAAVYTVGPGP